MRTAQRLDVLRIDGFARTDAGLLDVRGRLTRTGAFLYSDGAKEWREYRPPEEVFSEDAIETLKGAPLTVGHPGKITPENWSALAKGHVRDDVRRDGEFVSATVRVADAATIAAIEAGKLVELSCGYTAEVDEQPGEANGERYDAVQRNIRYNHVGLGAAGWGRAGPEVKLIMDAGVAIARVDVAFDQPPQAGPGLIMPSMGVSPAEIQANSPFQPNQPPGPSAEREGACDCDLKDQVLDLAGPNPRCLTCGRMALVGMANVPEMPHAQSTDIGDPYGHPPVNSPEALDGKDRAGSGYPRGMSDVAQAQAIQAEGKTKVKIEVAKVDANVAIPALEKKLAKAEARADSAEARIAELEKDRKDAADRFDASVHARVEILAKAATLLGKDLGDVRADSNESIMRKCLAKYRPSIKLDGKSADYVEAAFDALTEQAAQARQDTAKIDAGLSATTAKAARSDEAKDKMEKRAQGAWKGDK